MSLWERAEKYYLWASLLPQKPREIVSFSGLSIDYVFVPLFYVERNELRFRDICTDPIWLEYQGVYASFATQHSLEIFILFQNLFKEKISPELLCWNCNKPYVCPEIFNFSSIEFSEQRDASFYLRFRNLSSIKCVEL